MVTEYHNVVIDKIAANNDVFHVFKWKTVTENENINRITPMLSS